MATTLVMREATMAYVEARLAGTPHVEVTLHIAAHMPEGAPDHVVRTVTANGRTLRFTSQGFEDE
jgi:hypothetical protein